MLKVSFQLDVMMIISQMQFSEIIKTSSWRDISFSILIIRSSTYNTRNKENVYVVAKQRSYKLRRHTCACAMMLWFYADGKKSSFCSVSFIRIQILLHFFSSRKRLFVVDLA